MFPMVKSIYFIDLEISPKLQAFFFDNFFVEKNCRILKIIRQKNCRIRKPEEKGMDPNDLFSLTHFWETFVFAHPEISQIWRCCELAAGEEFFRYSALK